MVDIEPVAKLFALLANIERSVEIKRQVLSDHRNFNSDTLFELVSGGRGRISPQELIEFFNENGLTAEDEELEALLRLFDHNSDGILDKVEFKRTVLSQEHGFTDAHASKNSTTPKEIILSLLKIFDAELGGIKEVDRAKALFHAKGAAPLFVYFKELDRGRKGFLDLRDIYEVLTKFRPESTYTSASRVLRRLDRDNDQRVSSEEWERWFEPLLMSAGNIFNVLNPDHHAKGYYGGSNSKQPSNNYYERAPQAPTEVSYQMTPQPHYPNNNGKHAENTGTSLGYSKSPNNGRPSENREGDRYNGSRDNTGNKWTQQSGERSKSPYRPERESRVREVTTVHDRSPGRNEKRTYIVREYEDGTHDKEERIYEPLYDDQPVDAEHAVYRIERQISDAGKDASVNRPTYYNRSSEKNENPYYASKVSPGKREHDRHYERHDTFSSPTGPDDRSSAQKYLRTPGGKSYKDVSPMRNFRMTATVGQPETRNRTPGKVSPYGQSQTQSSLEPRYYQKGHQEKVVYSPPNQRVSAQKYADQVDGPYRREEVYTKSPLRGSAGRYPIAETSGTHHERSPQLKEEIITHKETGGGKQINTYIRKIYSNEKEASPYSDSKQMKSQYRDTDYLADTYGQDSGRGGNDFSAQKNMENRGAEYSNDNRVVLQNVAPMSPRSSAKITETQPFNFEDSFQLARSPKLSANFQMESTREYTELVMKESEKFKMRDRLETKLSKEDKFSSLTETEKIELVGCLKAKIGLFREIERARVLLAENFDFNLADIFFLAKKNSPKTYTENLGITYDEFKGIYDSLKIRVEERFIKLVFVRNDLDNDGNLSFFEFSELLGPFTPSLREDMNRRPTRPLKSIEDYPTSVKDALDSVLRAIAESEKETDLTREVTQHKLYSLFNLIDQSNKGILVFQDLKEVLEAYGSFTNDQELLALIRIFDFNKDGKISLTEFINHMSPLRLSQPYEHIRNKGY